MRLKEFVPFTSGGVGSAAMTTPQSPQGSQSGLSDSSQKKPWEMTRGEVRALSTDDLSENFWRPAAERIWKQAGSKEWQKIVDYYCRKYQLPEVSVMMTNRLPPNVNGEARMENGQWYIDMSPRLKNSPYESTIVLRHEIEHVIDHENNHFDATVDRARLRPGSTPGEMDVTPGHHKHYGDFNTDYAHRVVVRDALKRGEKIPPEVLKDYPGLH